ncbi:MAG: hypothetical protein Q8S92_22910 [Hydrogenophaga sp.]|uniref:hypothetical protein n=1 Tax=Hydrogenophaga sp. TaxID=1904254 RepID=UPI002734F5AE|nr:hypothetical protein [Hydrogenophaga sp.]MDP3351846.1 hypothetical protein [Hydrogenophaga sp.]
MKVIGVTELPTGYAHSTNTAFICIVTKEELMKVADKARYYEERERFAFPKVGDDYPIAEGHDFRNELLAATKAMTEAYTKFAAVAPLAARFAGIVAEKEGEQS